MAWKYLIGIQMYENINEEGMKKVPRILGGLKIKINKTILM
jgi:hypothetical protein